MSICTLCQGLLVLKGEVSDVALVNDTVVELPHHETLDGLRDSSSTCALCHQIFNALQSSNNPSWRSCGERPLQLKIVPYQSHAVKHEDLLAKGIRTKGIQFASLIDCIPAAYIIGKSHQGKPGSRAIWSADGEISFSTRVPVIREWLSNCLENHPNCEGYDKQAIQNHPVNILSRKELPLPTMRLIPQFSLQRQPSQDPFLPTRLLDVGMKDFPSKVKLINTKETDLRQDCLSYIALSHCWGPQPTGIPTLSTATQDKFRGAVDVNSLPKNFQDAIQVTRMLDIRYIWIDSLCIQQDSMEDWEYEASLMNQVYQNSLLTLSVTNSPDAHGGLHLNDLQPAVEVKLDDSGSTVRARIPAAQEEELHYSPLQARGWVLQELVLSRRTIHFTKNQMYWQCRCQFTSEDGMINDRRFRSLSYGWMPLTRELTWEEPASAYEHWWLWVHDFSHRKFTHIKDKVAAIAGITQFYAEWTEETPILGMWLEHLTKELSWYIETPRTASQDAAPTLSENKGLPSWTWLAHDTASVKGPFGRLASPTHRAHMVVLNIKLEWERQPYTSPIKSMSYMVVLAALKPAIFVRWPEEHGDRLSGHNHARRWHIKGQPLCEYTQCFLDSDVVVEQEQVAYCLFLGWNRFPYWDDTNQQLFRGFGSFLIVVFIDEEDVHSDRPRVLGRIGVGRFVGVPGAPTPFDPLQHDLFVLI